MRKRQREQEGKRRKKERKAESLLGLSVQLVFDAAQGTPFQVKKVAPG